MILLLVSWICNLHMVTLKCEAEVQTVSRQDKMHMNIQVLESQGEIVSLWVTFWRRWSWTMKRVAVNYIPYYWIEKMNPFHIILLVHHIHFYNELKNTCVHGVVKDIWFCTMFASVSFRKSYCCIFIAF